MGAKLVGVSGVRGQPISPPHGLSQAGQAVESEDRVKGKKKEKGELMVNEDKGPRQQASDGTGCAARTR